MLEIAIPGYKKLQIEHLVLDNGILACDGTLLEGVRERLETLANTLKIYVLTADTFGKAESELRGLPCELSVLSPDNQDIRKLEFIKHLGTDRTVCIGNCRCGGRNEGKGRRDEKHQFFLPVPGSDAVCPKRTLPRRDCKGSTLEPNNSGIPNRESKTFLPYT
jgi:hypothetical protein